LAVSINSEKSNKRFAEKIGATFPLLCDTRKAVSKDYGVLHPLFRVARRVTFVIGKDGIIRHIDRGSVAADPSGAERACSLLVAGTEKASRDA